MKKIGLLLVIIAFLPSLVFANGFTVKPFVTNVTESSIDICFQSDQDISATIMYGLTLEYDSQITVTGELFDALSGEYTFFQDPVYEFVVRYSYCQRIDGLEPDNVYHYSVQLGSVQTEDHLFATAPLTGMPFSFVTYGDSRSDPLYPLGVPNRFHENVVEEMKQHAFDFLLNVGDIVNDGYDIRLWEIALEEIAPISADYPYYPVFGNHERRNEQGVIGADVYSMLFSNPGEASGSGTELYYSFDYGNAHFTLLDTNTDIDPESEQGQWLRADLETASDNENIQWKFLLFHHPPYSASLIGIGDERSRVTREYIPPIAEEFGVDIVFAGHQHSYERSFKDGVYYIVTGNGGALPSFIEASVLNPYIQFFEGNPNFQHFGFCIIEIVDDYLYLESVISDGTVIDSLSLGDPPQQDDDDTSDDDDEEDDDTGLDDDDQAPSASSGQAEDDDDDDCCGS